MANVLNCVLNEFEPQSRFYEHFQINTLWKGMKPLIPRAMGYIVSLLIFYKGGFGMK